MIEVTKITKRFDGVEALSDVSCKIPDGKIYGLVGSNGAGKSTFLRVLSGIYKPDNGEVKFDGEDVWDNVRVKEKFVYVPDELYFLPGSNMKQMAKFYQTYYSSFDMERFERLSEQLKLNTKKRLSGFSKGMRRQAATVLALSCKPMYYFFDETFDGLDAVMREVVKSIIYEDICERNVTAIITSHSLRELENSCDHLALLHKGGLMFDSDVEEMKTSLVKVQFALKGETSREEIERLVGAAFRYYKQEGHMVTAIMAADNVDPDAAIGKLEPVFYERIPLSLEEFFTYEMENLGYSFELFGGEEENVQ